MSGVTMSFQQWSSKSFILISHPWPTPDHAIRGGINTEVISEFPG
jgi:hypothetical protein